MILTDTHCHLNLEEFELDRSEVLERAWSAGLNRILIPGLDLASSRRILALSQTHTDLFAAIGVHPNNSLGWDANTKGDLKLLFEDSINSPASNLQNGSVQKKIVSVGEIGLDYYWNDAPRDHQQKVLREQLALAAELKLPVILHMREAGDSPDGDCSIDLLEILGEWMADLQANNNPLKDRPGVLHSFSGSKSTADKVVAMNFCIGVTGPVTFKNAEEKREVVKSLPLNCLLIETDAPFLAPVPQRGRRNEPAFVRNIADKIAQIHNKDLEEIAAFTTANAARLFSWGG